MRSFYNKIIDIENSNKKAVLCTIISTKGSTPRKTGSKMIVYENGNIAGTIGGGALEKKVIGQSLEVFKSPKGIVVSHNLVNELGMCCGGSVELFIEPIMNKKKVYIFGAGHIGKWLAKFAIDLDFNVTLIDERLDEFVNFDLPQCATIQHHHTTAIEQLPFDENTCVVIVTHNHAYDREILALTSKKKNAYIGMVGSKRKVEIAKKLLTTPYLLNKDEVEKVDMPIGLDINAITPEEIAISILAKLIEVRNLIKSN